jgi:hypothetical protein
MPSLLFPLPAEAQDACGRPPEFTLNKEETERVQGDLKGAATFLKGFVGQADLGGRIEGERKKIYQNDATITAQQKDAYLYYTMCVLLLSDTALSTIQKLEELRKMRNSFERQIGKPDKEGAVEPHLGIGLGFGPLGLPGMTLDHIKNIAKKGDWNGYRYEVSTDGAKTESYVVYRFDPRDGKVGRITFRADSYERSDCYNSFEEAFSEFIKYSAPESSELVVKMSTQNNRVAVATRSIVGKAQFQSFPFSYRMSFVEFRKTSEAYPRREGIEVNKAYDKGEFEMCRVVGSLVRLKA